MVVTLGGGPDRAGLGWGWVGVAGCGGWNLLAGLGECWSWGWAWD